MNDSDEFLEHFGVKGMKWGKRKAQTSTIEQEGSQTPRSKSNKKNYTKFWKYTG